MSKLNNQQVPATRPLSVLIPVPEYDALRERAEASERTVSAVVRLALREYLLEEAA